MEEVIIIGAGGHGKVIADIIIAAGDRVKGFLDDNVPAQQKVLDFEVLGKVEDAKRFLGCRFILAIGDNHTRKTIAQKINAAWYTAIHPKAVVSRFAEIGAGTVVMPGAIVNASAKIGMHCILNTGAVVEHDNVLGDFVHISPNAALGGTVAVGECTHIGIGAVVRNNIKICAECTIGAGATVVKNIEKPGVYIGMPAKRM